MLKKLAFIVCLLVCLPVYSQAASQRDNMTKLSLEIKDQLESLKIQSNSLTLQLAQAESELNTQSLLVEKLKTELIELSTSSNNMNQLLSDYSMKLNIYETKLKSRAKTLTILWIMLGIMVLIKIALVILKVKFNIKIPYFLNILL